MPKIYAKKSVDKSKIKPKKETISFLLNYSKTLSYLKINGLKIENIAN